MMSCTTGAGRCASRNARRLPLALAALVLSTAPGSAQVAVLGTFTVEGKTTTWKQAYVSRHPDAGRPSQHYLVVLLADRQVDEADRSPARLQELAAAGQVQALRMVWQEGMDGIATTPFHKSASDSGQPTRGGAVIDLTRYDERQLEAQFKSKMLGQNWHFNARFKGPVAQGAPMRAEDPGEAPPTTRTTSGGDASNLKRQVGRLGYEWTAEGFSNAVKEPSVEAVRLFLQGGMSANTKDDQGTAVLLFASAFCGRGMDAYEQIVEALLAAGADVNVRNQNDSTPLIEAAMTCSPRLIGALIKAGADVNAKAKGGGTALMLAEVMKRDEIVAMLKKAGAKR
jgi:hypothetical protein